MNHAWPCKNVTGDPRAAPPDPLLKLDRGNNRAATPGWAVNLDATVPKSR
jgi:hypothetical protein